MYYLNQLKKTAKKDIVLTVSAVCALLSMFLVPPSAEYLSYLDFRVLILLFCLMLVISGFTDCGVFEVLAQKLLSGKKNIRLIGWLLIILSFFSSMFITNDVALITFVPFTILVVRLSRQEQHLIWILVFQTIAANLGSMATPVGNPQNLYLYGAYHLSAGDFFRTLLPLTVLALILLSLSVFRLPVHSLDIAFENKAHIRQRKKMTACLVLFLLCMLTVFRIFSPVLLLLCVLVTCLAVSPRLILKADYGLLATFICFFVFSGNLGNLPSVRTLLQSLLDHHALSFSVLSSQVISNVPSALLLSGFTDDWKSLLIGTNLGGLGTPVASLASLISLKFYASSEESDTGRYLIVFLVGNFLFLFLLSAAQMLLFQNYS